MDTDILWKEDTAVTDFDIDVPAWIDQYITAIDVAAICQGGCASGAYMPAVTYHTASATMAEHGDDVLDYIRESMGELPAIEGDSWKGIAVKFLSAAVELWASGIEDELAQAIEDAQEDEDEDEDEGE